MPSPTRRSFLVGAGTALASAAMLPRWMRAAEPGSRKLRMAVVGGRFGATFQFHEHPDCIVQAVSDLRPERLVKLQKTYRCQNGYASLEELVKDKNVEAVFVATPAPDHLKHVLACLEHGKHVLCAVPPVMSLDECRQLKEAVEQSGLTYMLAETSYWQQPTISARQFYRDGKFGRIHFVESEYHHPNWENLFFENGQRTWRHGLTPMLYPTHNTAHLISVTGERLVDVSCTGWGDGDPILRDNAYSNPFWNETALFTTDKGNGFRVAIWFRSAMRFTERAQYHGEKMSFFFPDPYGAAPVIVRRELAADPNAPRPAPVSEPYEQVEWWKTDMLPEPLRHDSGHLGSHTFITHEFVDACLKGRKPAVDIVEALAYTVPGIIAHESAMKDGERLKIPTL